MAQAGYKREGRSENLEARVAPMPSKYGIEIVFAFVIHTFSVGACVTATAPRQRRSREAAPVTTVTTGDAEKDMSIIQEK